MGRVLRLAHHSFTLAFALCGVLLGSGCPSRPREPQVGKDARGTTPPRPPRHAALGRASHEPGPPLNRVAPDRLLAQVPGLGAGAPLSLTASDGTGLVLSGLKASAVVSGPLGFTELHLTFDNPEDRTLEGRFEITLPTGAAVSRFAMLMSDGWREAEVVERQRARAAYEDFLHRRQDPALLEREAGNKFSARVFPIPARGRKELKLSYSQELAASDKPYRLPLAGLPRLGRLEIVAIAGDEVTQVIKEDFQPQQDYEVRAPQRTLASAQGLRSDRLAVARIKVGGAEASKDGARAGLALERVLLLVDTSASRAAGFDKQLELVGSLAEEIKKADPGAALQVAAFDQAVAPIFSGKAAGFGSQHLDALRARGPLGASDIEGALRFAKSASGVSRLILVTDGIATAYGGAGEQRAALQELPRSFQRLDVVMVGGIRDEVGMRSLAASVLPQPGIVLDGTQAPALLADRLRRPVLTDVKVQVAGAKWHWPDALEGVQPGDEVLIFAELEDKELGQSLKVQLSGAQTTEVALAAASGPLLERATAQALVQSLTHEHEQLRTTDKPAAAALREDIVKLSTRHRVLSDFTALLVLETERDYARFNLDRTALADILTVGERGIELFHRPPPEPPQPPRIALAPQGEQGPGLAEIRGPLDKELVRRVIRRHINEVKFCYEKELTRNPNLAGRVVVRFTIGTSGTVTSSAPASSSMGNPSVEQCIVSAVQRWEFPRPQGAEVSVTYPFVLKAAGDDSPPAPVNQDLAIARPRAAPPSDSLFAIRGPAPAEPSSGSAVAPPPSSLEEARDAARETARTAGVLGVQGAAPDSMASIFGRDSALGAEADSKLGGLVGTEVGDAYGASGFGLVGSGKGGGGTGEGTVGLGNLGTIGRGGGHAYGGKSGALRSRSSPTPITVPGTAEVRGSLDKELIRRIIRRHINEVKFCYERELTRSPSLQGRIMIQFTIGPTGSVPAALVQNSTLNNPSVEQCIAAAARRWEFPRPPGGGIVVVSYPFVLKTDEAYSPPSFPATRSWAPINSSPSDPLASNIGFGAPKQDTTPSYTGTMLEVMNHLEHQRTQEALAVAQAWRRSAPGDVLALTALGAAQDAAGNKAEAERAFGSILDLYPSRADLRRYAGSRLESLRGAAGEGSGALRLAADTYLKAVEQRPDHPNSHRLRAYALLKLSQPAEAFAALRKGLSQRYPSDRFRGVDQILREDLGLVAAAWRKADPDRSEEIQKQLTEVGVPIAVLPSLRFILSWETDANDVDFHIHDGKGGHAYYSQKELPSGGELYADVTTGYGPECFAIRGTPSAFPYRLEAHYYSRGPMGYGMGRLQILSHDGKGGMRFEDRPFVVMNDGAYVNLGSLEKPLGP